MVALVPAVLQRLGRWQEESRSDAELLREFVAAGDGEPFQALVGRHGPLVWRVCRAVLGHEQATEDAFQATFLALARQARALAAGGRPLAAWLHCTARRTALKARVALGRRARREALGRPRRPVEPSAELSARELLGALDEELARLSEVYRLPLLLCFWQGLTQDEAARQLGLSPAAVKGRLERGRAKLAARLARRGLAPSALLAAAAVSAAPAELMAKTAVMIRSGGTVPATVAALVETTSWRATRLVIAALLVTAIGGLGFRAALRSLPTAEPPPAKPPDAPKAAALVDVLGDPLPEGAIARMGTPRFRHWAALEHVAYSPDGKLLATGGTVDRQARLWDTATGRELAVIRDVGTIVGVAFSPDGKFLYCPGNDRFRILDVATKRLLSESHLAVHGAFALAPDGKTAVTGFNIRDVASDRDLRPLEGLDVAATGACFSRDGKKIATAGDDAVIRLFDAASGNLLHRLEGHKRVDGYQGHMATVAFSPDGKQVVTGGVDETARLWDVATGKELRRIGEHKGGIICVAFTPDGKHILTGGFNVPITLWDPATGKVVRRFPKRSEWATRVSFAPDGKRMAVGHWGNYAVRFWEVDTGREAVVLDAPEDELSGVVFSPDGRTLTTAGYDRQIRRWNADSGRELSRWQFKPLMNCLAATPDGKLQAGGEYEGSIYVWDAENGREMHHLKGHTGWILGLAFSHDGKLLASAGNDGSVRLWDPRAGTEFRRLVAHQRYARAVAFAPDNKTLASAAEDGTVRLWRVETGEELRKLTTAHPQNNAVAFSPDGRFVFCASTGERPIQVWDAATGRELAPFAVPGNTDRVFALALTPDGRTLIAACEDGSIRFWEVASRQERRRLHGHSGWVIRLALTPDGRRLASCSNDTTAMVWDLVAPSAEERRAAAALTSEQATGLWNDLAGDAGTADRAIRLLAAAPMRSVPLLVERLKPVAPLDAQQLARWAVDLDSPQFATREAASRGLEVAGELAVPALSKALAGQPTAEGRKRLQQLLDRQLEAMPTGRQLQALRAVEVLERAATPEARRALEALAKGAPAARLSIEAQGSLKRLATH